tara:strand:- start:150 stop:422 length:273 start_codon:yes stop_codon:yes gene_type:complete
MNITIELTETQASALAYVALSPQQWADNAVTNRARIAIDEICGKLMTYCNENEIAMAVGKDAQVAQAFTLGVVTTAAAHQAAAEEALPGE